MGDYPYGRGSNDPSLAMNRPDRRDAVVKSYDPKSYELAEHFLQDEPNLNTEGGRDNLAKVIQIAIEDWFEDQARVISSMSCKP